MTSAISCSFSYLILSLLSCCYLLSLASTLVFFRTGDVLSHIDTSTHRFPRFPPRNLCSLTTLAIFSLVYAATVAACCYAPISLELAESRILYAAPVDTRPRTSLIILHCPATDSMHRSLFGDSLSLSRSLSLCDLWSRPWGISRPLEFNGLPPCPHP